MKPNSLLLSLKLLFLHSDDAAPAAVHKSATIPVSQTLTFIFSFPDLTPFHSAA